MSLTLSHSVREHTVAAVLLAIDYIQKIMNMGLSRFRVAAVDAWWRPVFVLMLLASVKKLASFIQRRRASRIIVDKPKDKVSSVTLIKDNESEANAQSALPHNDCEKFNLVLKDTICESTNRAVPCQIFQLEMMGKTHSVHDYEKADFENDSEESDRQVQELLNHFLTRSVESKQSKQMSTPYFTEAVADSIDVQFNKKTTNELGNKVSKE